MKWEDREGSDNIEDRRSFGGGKKVGGITGIIVAAVITYIMSGGDIGAVLNTVLSNTMSQTTTTKSYKPTEQEQKEARFVSVVLKDTEDVWTAYFKKLGLHYQKPKLVLYRGHTTSGCGQASSAMGPFYCPADKKVYLDLDFFDELQKRFHAKGDFAQAYVIAHEVGHHVQNLLGILPKVHQKQRYLSKTEANKLSVKTELQADCFAGVWAKWDEQLHHILDRGDIDEALNAATQIGDDTLQKNAQGYAVPDSFTHGTSKQRREWFYKGFDTGDIKECNTFKLLKD